MNSRSLATGRAIGMVAVVSLAVLSTISCKLSLGENGSDDRDDTQKYLVDIASFLGHEWVTCTIRSEKDGDNISTSDIFGPDRSIIGRSYYGTHNKANSLAYFRQYVFLFTNESEANRHFEEEREWIFVYAYGVPVSNQVYPYRDLELPPEIVFQADEYQVACSRTLISNRCNGLLRYGKYIVFVDAFLIRDSVQYLTEYDLIAVLNLIDEQMRSPGDLINSQ